MLEIEELAYSRGDFRLQVSLRVEAGETGVVLGASGAGKSSLLSLIAGFLRPESGIIRLGGRRIDGLPPEKRGIGIVFQGDALFPAMTAGANIEYGLRVRGMDRALRRELLASLSKTFGLESLLSRLPRNLSGGERQRVALARTLATSPTLLLFDEALSSLDPRSRRELASVISRRSAGAGIASLHVSHDVGEALDLADRLFIMEAGRIVDTGSPRELYEAPTSAVTVRFFGSGPLIPIISEDAEGWITAVGKFASSQLSRRNLRSSGARSLFFPASRAALVSPSEDDPVGSTRLRLVVIDRFYRGSRTEVLARILGSEIELRMELPDDAAASPGEILCLRVPPEALRIVEDPESA